MMKHPDPRSFSALLDGELSSHEARELELHLRDCGTCLVLFQELAEIKALGQEMPELTPSRDLWPGISGTIQEAAGRDPDVIRLHPFDSVRRMPRRRKLHLSIPQAAAAGLALALVSGTVGAGVWRGAPPEAAVVQSKESPESTPSWVSLVKEANPGLEATALEVAHLEEVLAMQRQDLDPFTVEVLDRNLAIIDHAIEESVLALRADPGNRFLESNLERAIWTRGEYLRDASLFVLPVT